MTSTTTGLPDRYRPLDQVGADEPTPTGVIRTWRAKDRVLNRDVAVRVHTPSGPPAHEWITRALTAGGLATPALAMVYDASEGVGDPQAPGGAAYVVNEWIEGETLAERLRRGPLPEREVRTVLRRLAEGVAEAHRVGLAVGGLTPENVVLRPNGLVGLRGVPAATGTIDGDIAALGALLETCLTGGSSDPSALHGPSDLVALARRARSTEPGQALTSVAAMATLLASRPPAGSDRGRGSVSSSGRADDTDSGWLHRLKERRAAESGRATAKPAEATAAAAAPPTIAVPRAAAPFAPGADDGADGPVRLRPETFPPVPGVRPLGTGGPAVSGTALGGDTVDAGTVAPAAGAYAARGTAPAQDSGPTDESYRDTPYADPGYDDEPFDVLGAGDVSETAEHGYGDTGTEVPEGRRRAAVVGLSVLAVAVVVALAYWIGSSVLSVADSVDEVEGSTPSASAPADPTEEAEGAEGAEAPVVGGPVEIAGGTVYDPFGDGDPDHPEDVPLSYDGDPATDWATYRYLGGPDFGGLKPGVGVVYDLGSEQQVAAVSLSTTLPGSTVEIRTGASPDGPLESFPVATTGTLEGTTELTLEEPVPARYVLVWFVGLVPVEQGAQADIAEIVVRTAG